MYILLAQYISIGNKSTNSEGENIHHIKRRQIKSLEQHIGGLDMYSILFIFKFYLFLRRRREGERERHRAAPCAPLPGDLACNPGMCLRLGIEPATLWFTGQHSIH